MVVLDFGNPFFGEVASAAEVAAEAAGYGLVLAHSSGSPSKEAAVLELLEGMGVRGILLTPLNASPKLLATIVARDVPVVLVDCRRPNEHVSAVTVDNRGGGALAGQHLIGAGHDRIVMLNGPSTIDVCQERLAGLRDAAQDAGLDPAVAIIEVACPSTNEYEGQRAVDRVLAEDPTAVFCANDLLAVGLIRELTLRGLTVPGDLAVMGYDDIELAYTLNPPLSTIRQPMKELGSLAAQQLIAEIEGGGRPRQYELDAQLVIRESTGG